LSTFRQDHPDKKSADALVTASQFLWQVRYPTWDESKQAFNQLNSLNPNFQESFETINELHVPAGETILIHLTTRDVIHSFWIPSMRVKQDALPGHLMPVWFDTKQWRTDHEREFELVCAELCGWGHYRMRAKVVVHPTRADYENWLKQKTREQAGVAKK
jgi:cytochrome c oxidase subunit 2